MATRRVYSAFHNACIVAFCSSFRLRKEEGLGGGDTFNTGTIPGSTRASCKSTWLVISLASEGPWLGVGQFGISDPSIVVGEGVRYRSGRSSGRNTSGEMACFGCGGFGGRVPSVVGAEMLLGEVGPLSGGLDGLTWLIWEFLFSFLPTM